MILPNAILILFNVINSRIDAYRILKNKNIAHGVNFVAYAVCAVACILIFKINHWWLFAISAFFNRQITFDIPLNLRRGLKWDYVSLAKPPKALMDRIEISLFGYNGKAPTIIYGIIWVVTLILQFIL